MTPTLALMACLSAAAAPPVVPVGVTPIVQTPPPHAMNLAAQARANLDAAEALLGQASDPAVQRRIARKLAAARALLLEIEGLPGGVGVVVRAGDAVVVVGGGRVATQPVHPLDRGRPPISDTDFASLLASVNETSFSSQQLKALRSGTLDRGVTTSQVMELMGLFTFGRDQVEAAAMLHDHVVDREQWHRVYTVFKFTSDADSLRARVEDR